MKPTIWIFSIEPLENRYTKQWHEYLPKLLKSKLGDKFNIVQIDGIQKNTVTTPGAFLNFSDTNYWKSSQLCSFLEHHNRGETSINDHFIYTDAWNPTIIQLKYMSDLLGFKWTLHGLFHAGSYDKEDFLGRLIGDAAWVRNAERSFFYCYDHNYFATKFHIKMFCKAFGFVNSNSDKIVQTGWPMEYMEGILTPYKNMKKKDLILFPHRIAPEKQVEIFRDLKEQLPQYEFVVCQDTQLTKKEYHKLLGEAKLVFSANLQETLGISCYEGALLDAIPMVPNRLSYQEMYEDTFKYPSEWTLSFNHYKLFKKELCDKIIDHMENYNQRKLLIHQQANSLTEKFFSATNLLDKLTAPPK
jgi:hypothetical protein